MQVELYTGPPVQEAGLGRDLICLLCRRHISNIYIAHIAHIHIYILHDAPERFVGIERGERERKRERRLPARRPPLLDRLSFVMQANIWMAWSACMESFISMHEASDPGLRGDEP